MSIVKESMASQIVSGQCVLGIELGSTRIKAVLIDRKHNPIASGSYDWENRLESDVWTHHLDDVWVKIQDAYAKLMQDVRSRHGLPLESVAAMSVSATMHGYLVFDASGAQLAPFRTWRNTLTEQAAGELTGLFGFNLPQRWSVAHLYQAILHKERHVPNIAYLTTLAGYVHIRCLNSTPFRRSS